MMDRVDWNLTSTVPYMVNRVEDRTTFRYVFSLEMGKVVPVPVPGPNFFFWPGPGPGPNFFLDRDRDQIFFLTGTGTEPGPKFFWLGPAPKFFFRWDRDEIFSHRDRDQKWLVPLMSSSAVICITFIGEFWILLVFFWLI
jgi:hypothetical protein